MRTPPDPPPLRSLRDAFDAVVDLSRAERRAWLDANICDIAQRTEVDKLLAADDARGYLDTPVMERAVSFAAHDVTTESLIGSHIGVFRILREVGRGGMAAVFLAERAEGEVRQQVAVKLLRRGLYSELEQRLFLRERQLLAGLEHPNIARLIDAGMTASRVPYLVMEYVDGAPITEYADSANLDLRERLRLFIDVCRAVDAAHRRLIVHRDLKPSNILVTADGHVKLLDFGIAKLLEDDAAMATATRGVFTPEYAAPEQLRGEAITTATDVFGLGILLHELLTGCRPRGTPARRPSSIVDGRPDPAQPAKLGARRLRGDLDNIVLKALEEEPSRRYVSANTFADDIENFLVGRPVLAHPMSRWYRTRKFVRRHRGSVVTAAAVVLAIAAAMALVVWQAHVANLEAQRANAVRDFVESVFEPLNKGVPETKQPRISELLAQATQRIDHADLDTAARIDLLQMFARLNEKIAESAAAQSLADRAHALAQETFGPDDRRTTDALVSRGLIALHRDDLNAAAPMLGDAERDYRRQGISGAPLIRLYDGLAVIADAKGDDPQRTVDYERKALQERLIVESDDAASIGTGYNNLGYGLESLGDFEGAADAYRHAYTLSATVSGGDSIETAVTLSNLGSAEMLAGKFRQGRDDLSHAKKIMTDAGGKMRPIQIANVQQLCVVESLIDPLHASDACGDDLRVTEDSAGTTSPDYAMSLRRQALLAFERGDIDGASVLLEKASALLDPNSNPVQHGRIEISRGELDLALGKPADAAHRLHDGIAGIGGSYPPYLRKHALGMLALACDGATNADCDSGTLKNAMHEIDSAGYHDSATLLAAHTALARIALRRGDASAALDRLQSAIQNAQGEVSDSAPRLLAAHAWLAQAQAAAHRCDDAGATFRHAYAIAAADGLEHNILLADVLASPPLCADK